MLLAYEAVIMRHTHEKGIKVKLYNTIRELTYRANELFALRSLGDEILSRGPGGGPAWLQEHLGDDYIAGWYVERLRDAQKSLAGQVALAALATDQAVS